MGLAGAASTDHRLEIMMGTSGTDLLGSDSALDFLDKLSALPAAERSSEITRVLALAADDPSSIMRDIVPEEAIAAAVLVAASLPATEELLEGEDESASNASLPEPASIEIRQLAIRAIDVVAEPDGWWRKSWADGADAIAAGAAINRLRSILRGRSE